MNADAKVLKFELARLRNGDQNAWSNFIKRITPTISDTIRKSIRYLTSAEAIELEQESFLRIVQHFNRVADSDNVLATCRSIAKNVCSDYRHRQQHPTEWQEINPTERPDVSPKEDEHESLLRFIISELSKSEPKRDIAIFLLYYRYGLTALEISRLYPLSVKETEAVILRLVRQARNFADKRNELSDKGLQR